MTEKTTSTTSADERAARAVDALVSEGASVTGAAVRERSGVRMATAHAAAKAWRDRNKPAEEATVAVPDKLQTQFRLVLEEIWREARALSRAEFDEARIGWEAKLHEATTETAKLTVAVDELEQENDKLEQKNDKLEQKNERIAVEAKAASKLAADEISARHVLAAAEIASERSRADRAEGALEVTTAERDRLLAELEAIRAM